MGLEGSGASRRPGSIVRVLRTERWVQPTERAGSEGSFICRCLGQRKPYNRPDGRGNAPLLVAGATTFPPVGGLYSSLCVSFILPPLAGEVRCSRKGGGERSEPISRMVILPYDADRLTRNADFISIAAERQSATLGPKGPVKLKNPPAAGRSILRTFPLNLLNPLNLHAAGVSTSSEHNFSPIAFPKRGIIKKHITKNFRYENRSGMPGQLQGEIFC